MYKILGFLLVGVLVFNCGKAGKQLVVWQPENPRVGQILEIQYYPEYSDARIPKGSAVQCMVENMTPESTWVESLPMQINGDKYWIQIKLDRPVLLLGFKFEAENGLTEDNAGRGWNVLVQNAARTYPRDSYYFLGKVWDSRLRPGAAPDYHQALALYQKELHLNPTNYKVWHAIWQCRLKLADNPTHFIGTIKKQLDSLLTAQPRQPDVLKLAYDTYRTLIPNTSNAVYYGSEYLKAFPQGEQAAKIAYFLIFLKEQPLHGNLIHEIIEFLNAYPQFSDLRLAYETLMEQYLVARQPELAYTVLEKLLQLEPRDFSHAVTAARLSSQMGNLPRAEAFITQAFEKCTLLNSQILFPWINGFTRAAQHRIDLAGIHSTQAYLHAVRGDLEAAIKSRQQALELGTPFPAYELELIGNTYLALNNPAAAKNAFAEALIKSPGHEGARQGLFQIYKTERKSVREPFETYLQQVLSTYQQGIAKPIANITLRDLADQPAELAQEKGNIVVLYFGATVLWENDSLLNRLNKLVDQFKADPKIKFWAISIEAKATLQKFFQEHTLHFRILPAGETATETLKVPGFPSYIIVAPNGYEYYRQVGEIDAVDQLLSQKIKEILALIVS
ncbi:TlpA family protein disulfide reductase [candidate division KSB1 bacterium]|nr:TlpA family protein disulfide reductase [candidate division KSB1 bacterium]